MRTILLLSAAGAAGTLARYGLTHLISRLAGEGFPWGTWATNALGCLLFGIVVGLADQAKQLSAETRAILLTGFMGAFTTFSTFAYDTHQQWTSGQLAISLAHAVGQIVTGVILVAVGSRF